ncbi:tRNA pseudouridine synthase A [Candidatus Zixiibacteriota bacterium]|nr:tRNA pseudouridine synthase A [candidate division Zixibacteria bacterium]
MAEINIRLDIQYKGTDFAGWQFQPSERTIQGELETAIGRVTGKRVVLTGAGRTDAGVHALGQVANFRVDHNIHPEKYKDAINYYLPRTILVTRSSEVPAEFDARRSARSRYYRYIIDRQKTALYYEYRWEYPGQLSPARMNEAAAILTGRQDCSAFCTVSSQKENNDCEIYTCGWADEDSLLIFEIRANRFVHSMVRSIVGLMAEMGKDKEYLTLEEFKDIMASGDHTRIKHVAPARGLYLVGVEY